MNRELIIQKTIDKITKLPDHKLIEVSDFAEFLLTKIDDQILVSGLEDMVAESESFSYLKNEEDLYSIKDVKEKY